MSSGSATPFGLLEHEQYEDHYQTETPFSEKYFSAEAWLEKEAHGAPQSEQQWVPQLETPFLAEYHGQTAPNPNAQALEQTLMELFDRDFNEAVANLAMETSAQAQYFASTTGTAAAEQLLTEWLDPVRRATEQLFEQVGEAANQQFEALSEEEADSFFERHAPQPGMVAPEFEDFLKAAWKKVKGIARTAINAAKKGVGALAKLAMPVGVLLKKLAQLVRPLLNRVIRFAIGKLPTELRPAARLLGKRLGILKEAAGEAEHTNEVPTTPAAEALAHEFDASVATLMFAANETETEMFLQEAVQETQYEDESSDLRELDAARERFVSQFAQLQTGENPGPVVQQFIPAILPLLRIGITVIGRQRVVNFLAGYLARLIKPYVGPGPATALSRALVSVGMRMITLEAEAEAPPQMAARAVAATLEDTVRRVAEFGFEQFDSLDESREQQQLLESITTEAFFQATMEHFPKQLLDPQRFEEREMHLTTDEVWAYRPTPRYKKYTRVFDVTITAPMAAKLRTFGSQPLDAFLRAKGIRLPMTAKVHLYEAIAGTMLSQISLLEKRVPGLGSGSQEAWGKIHPLTTEAAGLLLGQPNLGRDVDPRFLQTRNNVGVGQRFYYIEISQGGGSIIPKGRPSEVNVTVDLKASQVRAYVFFSEADAQRIVAAGPSAGAMTAVRIAEGLAAASVNSIATGPTRHVTFIREATGELEGEEFWQRIAGEAAKKIIQWLLVELAKALLKMLKAALIRYFNAQLASFTTATRSPADGVTIVLTFNHPGLRVLHVALAGRVPNMADVRAAANALQLPSTAIVPGFKR